MQNFSRFEDGGMLEPPVDWDERADERERKEAHDEDEADERRLREGEK